jgi:lipopolysaccharide transport system ATP-binding protein
MFENVKHISVAIGVNSWSGENKTIFSTAMLDADYWDIDDIGYFECVVNKFPLSQGKYLINIFIQEVNGDIIDWIQEAANINVENGDFFGTGKVINTNHQSVLVEHSWNNKNK